MYHVDYSVNGTWCWTLSTVESEIPSPAAMMAVVETKIATPKDAQSSSVWCFLENALLENDQRKKDQPGEQKFFSVFNEYAMYCGIAWRQTFQECFEFISFHFSNCCIYRVKTIRNNNETDKNKSAQYKVKPRRYKWLLIMTENLFKKVLPISQVRTCVFALRALRHCEFHSNSDI